MALVQRLLITLTAAFVAVSYTANASPVVRQIDLNNLVMSKRGASPRSEENDTPPRASPVIDLSKIRVVDHSVGNFDGLTQADLDEMYRGLSARMTCDVGFLQDVFSSSFLDSQGVYGGSLGAGVSCPFSFEATVFGVGPRFSGTLSLGAAACPPTLFVAVDSNLASDSWQVEPNAELPIVPGVASLVLDLDTDTYGNYMLKVTMSILDTDLELAKDIYLGFSCDDLGFSVY